jgi:hypothetical protein
MEKFEYICSQQYEWATLYKAQETKRKLQKNREEKARVKNLKNLKKNLNFN